MELQIDLNFSMDFSLKSDAEFTFPEMLKLRT